MAAVLVLDADQRSALAATRALGSRGIAVFAADEAPTTLAGSSKYCAGTFTYPSPDTNPDAFVAGVARAAGDRGVTVIFPMSDTTTYLLARHRSRFQGISIPVGSPVALDTLLDKWEFAQLASRLDIPVPRTYAVSSLPELARIAATLQFPVVVKPRRSRTWVNGRCIGASVRYANSIEELESMVARGPHLAPHDFLLQEYVRGEARGVFALYAAGQPIVFFAHRRLREKPPSGGVSVLSESIAVDSVLRELARRILDRVAWHGVVMLEFKVSPAGIPFLIEANPRFWGSLQLAVDAGVNFPHLLYQVAVGAVPAPVRDYKTGVRSRWLLGDLDHLYLTLRGHDGPNLGRRSKWKAVASFFHFFDKATRYEINRREDPRPFLVELRRYFRGSCDPGRHPHALPRHGNGQLQSDARLS